MPFGKVLRSLRIKNSMTQKQLADTLGVSESRIGMYERCQREPDFEMLEAIADYFNVDMDYLTGRTSIERQYTFSPESPADPAPALTDPEQRLLDNYRDLNDAGRDKLLDYAEDLVLSGRYEKASSPSMSSAG
ncbi:MAG: helix-turn-helix transcriptional regulator [Stomatobaculum sp.]|nr:helix-turn-helix transcriptional regulator [Stomatobaculum sp.]MBR7058181.1 helix-turn-helix transcriptional regulator [Stomatobaculum sp.]